MVEDKRKSYMRDEYSKYWISAREKKYGFLDYDKALCEIMKRNFTKNGKILEVAIGTGFPFAQALLRAGYKMFGVDISPKLIKKCKIYYPEIECKVGDAENLEYEDNIFDATYCLHSTFYFPNLERALQEIVRVTRKGGHIFFDIQNSWNPSINAAYQKQIKRTKGAGKLKQIIKNIKGIVMKGAVNWDFVVYEIPTDPQIIFSLFLKSTPMKIFASEHYPSGDLIQPELNEQYRKFPRLIFLIQKQ